MPFWIMPIVWGSLIAILLVVEYVTHELVTIWFAAGFIVGLVISFTPIYYWWHLQLGASVAVSAVLLILTRPAVKKWLKIKQTPLNIDKRIGYKAHLVSPITADGYGTIQINDVLWHVTAKRPIENGKLVKIIEITGSKFVVVEADDDDTEIFTEKQ